MHKHPRHAKPYGDEKVPDPARSYERAKPEAEAGMGRRNGLHPRPSQCADGMHRAVGNRHKPRQLNAEDVVNAAGGKVPGEDVPEAVIEEVQEEKEE